MLAYPALDDGDVFEAELKEPDVPVPLPVVSEPVLPDMFALEELELLEGLLSLVFEL